MLNTVIFVAVIGLSAARWTKEDYRITGFDLPQPEEMYSGYMPIHMANNNEGSLFFWMSMQRPSKKVVGKERIVIWLNGGPGCSSMLGNLMENGPLALKEAVNDTWRFESNPYSWNEEAHVIFVEQPIRTGYSQASASADKTRSEIQVARDFRGFMTSLLETFPELQGLPVTISGESYAGFYIPWMSEHILRRQLLGDYEGGRYRHINLQGAAIGNGVIDYVMMIPSYAEFMYANGFIPLAAKDFFDKEWKECLDRIVYSGNVITNAAFSKCNVFNDVLTASGGVNIYNVDAGDYTPLWITLGTFMNNPRVQEIIHARGKNIPGINFNPEDKNSEIDEDGVFKPKQWQQCNDVISQTMRKDHPVSTVPAVAFMIQHMKVMFYSGAIDLICNYLGTLHTLEANTWNGRSWKEAKRGMMFHEKELVGPHYKLKNLSMLVIRGSGHLMPMDKPSVALEMMRRFLDDISFNDKALPDDEYYSKLIVQSAKDQIQFDDTVDVRDDNDDDADDDDASESEDSTDNKASVPADKKSANVKQSSKNDDDDNGVVAEEKSAVSSEAPSSDTDTASIETSGVQQVNWTSMSSTSLTFGLVALVAVVATRQLRERYMGPARYTTMVHQDHSDATISPSSFSYQHQA